MGHRIGPGPLKHSFRRHTVTKSSSRLDVLCELLEHAVKPDDLVLERWQTIWAILTADVEGPRIPQNTRHMPDELRRRTHRVGRPKLPEVGRRIADRFCLRYASVPRKCRSREPFSSIVR